MACGLKRIDVVGSKTSGWSVLHPQDLNRYVPLVLRCYACGGIEIDSGKRSKREVEEFNVHPNVIKSLGVGRCVRISKYPRSRSAILQIRSS